MKNWLIPDGSSSIPGCFCRLSSYIQMRFFLQQIFPIEFLMNCYFFPNSMRLESFFKVFHQFFHYKRFVCCIFNWGWNGEGQVYISDGDCFNCFQEFTNTCSTLKFTDTPLWSYLIASHPPLPKLKLHGMFYQMLLFKKNTINKWIKKNKWKKVHKKIF